MDQGFLLLMIYKILLSLMALCCYFALQVEPPPQIFLRENGIKSGFACRQGVKRKTYSGNSNGNTYGNIV